MNTKPLQLLIVEDEAAHVEAIRRAFAAADSQAEIRAVGTLREYRELIAASPPDLALVDLNLPDGRAVQVLTHPSADTPFPILVMTAFGSEPIAVEMMKAGALDYVVKSAEAFAALPQTVARALSEWQLLQQHTLGGYLPICAWCKKIRDDQGYWKEIETFVATHSEAHFSHGICPNCEAGNFPEQRMRQSDNDQEGSGVRHWGINE